MLEVGSQPMLSPKRLFLSYPGLHIVSHSFRACLAAANRVFSINSCHTNTSVTSIDLGSNEVGNEGATAIAKMLEVGSQPMLSPKRLFLSYPGLLIASYAFGASLAAANPFHFFDVLS